jgi:type II restriction enzyme
MKKFDFAIGNPPYQESQESTSDNPIYNIFMDSAYTVANRVELITPARFLFGAGKTPKAWNEKMLTDKHLKIEYYEQNSSKVFSGTDIKGGIVISYRNINEDYGGINVFTAYPELNEILNKVIHNSHFQSLSQYVYAPESYKFTLLMHNENPGISYKSDGTGLLSKGHDDDLTSNIFDKLTGIVFFDEKPEDSHEYIQIIGRSNNARKIEWIRRDYIIKHKNLLKYKVILPKSNGSGAIGETLSTPLVGQPLTGHTQTFISIGAYNTKIEADNTLKYIETKFARTMLGVLKVTQDNKRSVWKYVPLQDFTRESDIDWSKSIHEIDLQLYKKYGLDDKEINFIETHVKEME